MRTMDATRRVLTLSLGLMLAGSASAQIELGGRPASSRFSLREECPTCDMEPVDVAALRAEDVRRGPEEPFKWGELLPVEIDLAEAGVWEELPNGDRVCRLRVHSAGAYSIMLTFSRFQLSEGAELFVYNDDRSVVRGAYTYQNNKPGGLFAIQPTPGEAVTLEYFEPRSTPEPGQLVIDGVIHDYADVTNRGGGPGTSSACEVDVICPQGAGWDDQIDATVRIIRGNICCSGTLLNNAAGDGTPLLLTAGHCGNLDNAVFFFNFKRNTCGSGGGPQTDSLTGSAMLAEGAPPLDFQMVRLSAPVPVAYGAYYAGWDRTDTVPATTTMLHHPSGDWMKISVDDQAPVVDGVNWNIVDWDTGVTEGGSSGAPLFDPNRRLIGHMDEGQSICSNPINDFITRFSQIWPDVEHILDPFGTGITVLDGVDPTTLMTPPFSISSIDPPNVPVLEPGTDKTVQIVGMGFTPATTVELDGNPVDPASTELFTNSRLAIDMPQVDIGMHSFTVREGASSGMIDVTVTECPGPKHQAGTGDPGNQVTRFTDVDVTFAGPIGHTMICLWSTSSIPSVHPSGLGAFDMGNMFTQLYRAGLATVPASGHVTVTYDIMGGLGGMTVYSQTWDMSAGLPAQVSNLQETFVVF